MEIFIGADHNGFDMKGELVEWLRAQGHSVTDMGPSSFEETDDYPDFGIAVSEKVAENTKDRFGILLCASGVGMSVIADKIPGIRAALIHDPAIAERAQRDDDINVLALGSEFIAIHQAKDVISSWLATPFSKEDRHVRRISKISDYEDEHTCQHD